MLRMTTKINLVSYYFADQGLDYDGRYWEPRIVDSFTITRFFQMNEGTGNRVRTVSIELDNHDGYFDSIQNEHGLVNQKFELFYEDGDGVNKKFTGRVNKIDSYGSTIRLTLREIGYEFLDSPFPDAQIAYDYYSKTGINENWNAVPIHFGYVYRFPVPWVNLALSQFMVGSGPVYKVARVYLDKEIIYDEEESINGYTPGSGMKEIKVRVFRGTGITDHPEVVDGHTSDWPGFSYIELYHEGDEEEPALPLLADGETAQVFVDVVGIENELQNGPVRNPAKIIYNCLTKPITSYEGYGLGIPIADVDFSEAFVDCENLGFYIDGTINQVQPFGNWLDELLRSCRGMLFEEDGKIKLTIDMVREEVAAAFDDSGETGIHCNLDSWTEPALEAQYNRMRLSYDYEAEFNRFRKKPKANHESPLEDGDTYLVDEIHASKVLKYITNDIEFKLIADDITAHKLAQYYFKKCILQLKSLRFTTVKNVPDTLDAGDLITITSKKFGWTNKEFLIVQIDRTIENTVINVNEYDSSVYDYAPITPKDSPEQNPYSKYTRPDKPILSEIIVRSDLLKDGTTQTRLNFKVVKPAVNCSQVIIYYKPAAEPESSFRIFGSSIEEDFDLIWVGINSGVYNFRAVSLSMYGVTSELMINPGDKHYHGQPGAEDSLEIIADKDAPGTPIIERAEPIIGGVSLYLTIAAGLPADFSHFIIYRKLGEGEEEVIEPRLTNQVFVDGEYDVDNNPRSYAAEAVDLSGNVSDKCEYTEPVIPIKTETELGPGSIYSSELFAQGVVDAAAIAEEAVEAVHIAMDAVHNSHLNNKALKKPEGAVLSLSAKNCTTESIANPADGVKDISGFGNHGKATEGVEVVHSDIGHVFKFNTLLEDFIILPRYYSIFDTEEPWSVAFWIKLSPDFLIQFADCVDEIEDPEEKAGAEDTLSGLQYLEEEELYIFDYNWHHVAVVNEPSVVYLDALDIVEELLEETGDYFIIFILALFHFFETDLDGHGRLGEVFVGELGFVKIYARGLQGSEVKTLYMFPEDVVFGRVTADIVTANELITQKAQIKHGTIEDAHITNLDAGKIKTGDLDADRIVAGSIAGSKLAAHTITATHLLIGSPGAALNEDPNFEDVTAWFSKSGDNTFTTVNDGKVGNNVLRSSVGGSCQPFIDKYIPIDLMKTYRVRAWVRRSADADGKLYISWQKYDKSFTKLDSDEGAYIVNNVIPATVWTEYAVLVGYKTPITGQASAKYMRIGLLLNYGATEGYMEVQDFRIEECLPTTLIQDGAIITDKIAANAITASKLDVTALKFPAGVFLQYQAKGSTGLTKGNSIGKDNGVIDISGHNYHGKATDVYIHELEIGHVFKFYSGYIIGPSLKLYSAGNVTFSAWVSVDDSSSADANFFGNLRHSPGLGRGIGFGVTSDGTIKIDYYNTSGSLQTVTYAAGLSTGGVTPPQYLLTFILSGFNYKIEIYINGKYATTVSTIAFKNLDILLPIVIGRADSSASAHYFKGTVSSPMIYMRGLTPEEIKTLYMLGTDRETGVISADRITVGELDGDLITANTITGDKISVGTITANNLSVTSVKTPFGAVLDITPKGCTTASIGEPNGVIDISGYGNHNTAHGDISIGSSEIGKVFTFGGTNGYFGKYNVGLGYTWTFTGWFKRTNKDGWCGTILSKAADGTTDIEINSIRGGSDYHFHIYNIISKTYTVNEWHHFVITREEGETEDEIALYFDGVFVANYPLSGVNKTKYHLNGNLIIGNKGGAVQWYKGQLGNLKFYDRVLQDYEIKTLFMNGPVTEFGLIQGVRIEASAITANHIVASAITTAKIAAGAITGDKISAGSITVSKLYGSGYGAALNDDPACSDATAWVLNNVTVEEISDGIAGNTVLRSTFSSATIKISKWIPVAEDKIYRLRFYARSDATSDGAFYAGYITPTKPIPVWLNETLTPDWKIFETIINVNEIEAVEKNRIKLVFTLNESGTQGYHEIQDVRFEEVLPSSLIGDGTITADKIIAGAVDAHHLSVTALKIPAGAVLDISVKGSTTESISKAGGVIDVSGNENHGRSLGPTLVASDIGQVFSFAGNADCLVFFDLNITQDFTISIWIYLNDDMDGEERIIHQNGLLCMAISGVSNRISFADLRYSLTHNVVVTLDTNRWYHLVGIGLDGAAPRLFVDGGEIFTTAITDEWSLSGDWLYLGGDGVIDSFDGLIGYPKIFHRALTDSEIKTLYMLGTDSESGVITADRVRTGKIESTNYDYNSGDFSEEGTLIDLDNGKIRSKSFAIDELGNAKFKGDITGASGVFTGSLSVQGFKFFPENGICGFGTLNLVDYTGSFSMKVEQKAGVNAPVGFFARVMVHSYGLPIIYYIGGSASAKFPWIAGYARCIADSGIGSAFLRVRFTRDSNYFYIVFGDNTTTWGWGHVLVEMTNGDGTVTLGTEGTTTDLDITATVL